ncbi:hypothetical protein NUU61_008445 [Penicillium alfredii]|uniref:Carrier domain-containing protein n=1 Tax=Penicillium alfredii TaxID=1506179 RepID=A0A9W9JWE8_9EURO|nr:uncharacterized protein NUU61_008445 [Penicillium alfredii]KAJ5083866.1 hypothetical protein NUU61_008445 [Penicillium alfredii]
MGIRQGDHTASSSAPDPLIRKFGRLDILDDLIRLRAADAVQPPILAYPSSDHDAASYEYYTGQDLDDMIDSVVAMLMDIGFSPPKANSPVVALLTPSDLSMVITLFALSRLGYTVMMLSPRLAGEACVSLLEKVGCDTIIYGNTPSIRSIVGDIIQRKLVTCRPTFTKDSLQNKDETRVMILRQRRDSQARNKVALILHSSGSTGTPKPLFLTHKALMTHPLRGPGLTSFNPLPWYHLHGLSTALQAMWMRKTAFMWSAALPLTAESVVAALEAACPQSVAAVPYMLQLLVDQPRGIAALRRCHLVTYGGAPCPDELGDRLVVEGVHFGGSFGLTEAGLVAESVSRPKGDPYWNYLRFFDNIRPYIWMKPIGESLYECVYLAGHPALTTSNSNEPLGSFHSKDVFMPHPTIPGRWKYASRLDDRITLVNGEKVLPLPIEGHIKQHPLIHEAVVVGLGKAIPGLLILRAPEAAHLPDDEYFARVWPTVSDANSRAEQFSQIARDMVALLPHDSYFPRTDKGSMIRARVYQHYAGLINGLYRRADRGGELQLSLLDTRFTLLQLCREELGIFISGVDASFFTEGVDSLKAIHLRRLILRQFKFDSGQYLSQNVVFETGSISQLAKVICAVQQGENVVKTESDFSVMVRLIHKYSLFRRHIPRRAIASNMNSVILTGATGFIGAHTLFELLHDRSISTVFCLTRRESPLEAVIHALAEKDLHISLEQASKITALTSGLDQPEFGLEDDILRQMRHSVTKIIHIAWPVHFNLPLGQFESHIKGLYNLIQFSLSVQRPEPAVLMFCSSISTVLAASSSKIHETPTPDLTSALDMGYGRSKLVGERIVSLARQSGARTHSLRIGQVSGHSKKGLWNDTEALPLMIRSALILRTLPDLPETCSWLPVDKLAATIAELATVCSMTCREYGKMEASSSAAVAYEDDSIYNVCNSRKFAWSSLLASLKRSGFQFDAVPFEKWLQMLRESEARGEEHVNPAVKLIDHYDAMYSSKSSLARGAPKTFVTEKAERDSVTLRNDHSRIIEDGILSCYVRAWLTRWTRV